MTKLRFLKDFDNFQKDTYRVILAENELNYIILIDIGGYSTDMFEISKSLNGIIYEVIERS